MMRNSVYSVERHQAGSTWFVCLTDADAVAPSITNNAENVLTELVEMDLLHPGERVIYRDTDGIWDEVVIDERCTFVAFAPLRTTSRDAAISIAVSRTGAP
jgi:hypothetical protein